MQFSKIIQSKVQEAKTVDHCTWWGAIGPAEASYLLSLSQGNRHESKAVILQYVHDMQHGAWVASHGTALIVSKAGRLIDGHHRLQAVIKANIAIGFAIAFGEDDARLQTLDCHRARNAAARVTLAGTPMSTQDAADLRSCMWIARKMQSPEYIPTASEMIEHWGTYKDDILAIHLIVSKKFRSTIRAPLAFLRAKHVKTVDDFAKKIALGEGVEGTPYYFREWAIRNAGSRSRVSSEAETRNTIHAIRAQLDNKTIRIFRSALIDCDWVYE